jgi:S1-C subfamily serine protease
VLTAQVHNIGYNEVTYQPGVRVPMVQKDSAAARYGLLPGDIILEVDGAKVKPGAPIIFGSLC